MDRGDNTHVIELLLEERLGRGEAGEGEDGGGGQLHRWIKTQQQCVWKNEVGLRGRWKMVGHRRRPK